MRVADFSTGSHGVWPERRIFPDACSLDDMPHAVETRPGGREKHAFGPRAAEVIPRAFGPRVRDGKMHASGPRETISHAFGPHARENVARRFKAMRWPELTIHPRARETQTTTRLRASRQE